MRGSREAPNWVWRARRGKWAKVPLSGERTRTYRYISMACLSLYGNYTAP